MTDEKIALATKPQLLKEALLRLLRSGNLKPGDRFLSEPEMIARFGVSRSTVREAVVSLEQEGWLTRAQGKGTFVNEHPKVFRTVAVIAPYLYANDSPDFRAGTDVIPILMQSIENHARKMGLGLSLYLDNMDVDTERENLEAIVQRKVDAALVWYIGGDQNLDALQAVREKGIPLVLFDRYLEDVPVDAVLTDNHLGAYQATNRFFELGVRDVVYITGPVDSTVLRDRQHGYVDAMTKRGHKPKVIVMPQEVGEGVDRINYERAREVVQSVDFPTAVFTSDATRLAVVLSALEDAQIPRTEFALGCFDEPYLNLPNDLILLRVLQPLREIGRKTIDLTIGRLDGDVGPPNRLLLPPDLYVTGAPSAVTPR